MTKTAPNVSEKLKELRRRSGLSVRAVAEALGLPATTYHYYETTFKQPHLPVEIAEKLAALFEKNGAIDPAEVMSLAGVETTVAIRGGRLTGFSDNDLVEFRPPPEQENMISNTLAALYPGRPAANVWQIKGPALELAGYLPGDLVIVDLNITEARSGDVVCAQIYNWHDGSARTVIRMYEPPYLVAMSRDPTFRKPELVDNDRVAIKGLVVASFRRPS